MSKIEIQVSRMLTFLSYLSCEGKTEDGVKSEKVIKEFIIHALDNKIEACAIDRIGKLYSNVEMSVTVLEPGQIVIGDVDLFIKYLNAFGNSDTVTISNNSGIITIQRPSPKKIAKFLSVTADNIETNETAKMIHDRWTVDPAENVVKTASSKLDSFIVANAEDFMQIIEDSQIVGEKLYPFSIMEDDSKRMILKIDVGSLESSLGVIKSLIPTETIRSGLINNKYAYGMDNIFSTLSGKVKIYTAQNAPLWIVKEEEGLKINYLLTPVVS